MDCIWKGTEEPRALKDRHGDACEGDGCRGCLRCPRLHCVVCGIEHVDEQTCPGCVGAARDDLYEVALMFAALPGQTIDGGHEGKLEAARPIPGGESMVMLGPGAQSGEIGKGEHQTTLMVLVGWEDDWRSMLGNEATEKATVPKATRFLRDRLDWAAQQHPAFDAFVEEVRAHRAHLEDVLHDGQRTETGAPCNTCHRPLERSWGATAKDDGWWCANCKTALDAAEYVERVSREARRHKGWLTARDMQEEHRIKVGTLQSWAAQEKVSKRKDINLGRMVYSVKEAKAMRDAREDQDNSGEVA